MNFIWNAVKAAFAGMFQGILALFGMSDEEKLGRGEVTNAVLTENLKEKTHEAEVFAAPDRAESAVLDDMLKHAGK